MLPLTIIKKIGINSPIYPEIRFNLIENGLKTVKGAQILDLGCGSGFLGFKLELNGNNVTYADVELSQIIKKMRKTWKMGDVVKCDGGKLPFRDSSFDYVVSTDVLEHISSFNRVDLIKEITRISIKGIHITFSTFCSRSPGLNFFKKMFKVFRVTHRKFLFFGHEKYRVPNIIEIEHILEKCRLNIINKKPYRGSIGLFLLGFRISLLLFRFPPARFKLMRIFFYPLVVWFYFIEKFFDYGPCVAWYLHLSRP
jgi:SAM-dependent methyltransferase